jgi:phosphatidylserine synthase
VRAPVHDLHVSNLLTYAALAAALSSILLAMDGQFARAAAAIGIAAIADTFDGRFARLFARTAQRRQHGKEIDSLVDVVAFGVAPVAVLLGAAGLGSVDGLPWNWQTAVWWSGAFFYVLAAATRLAHYNVAGDDRRFVGLPTPAAALLCATSLLLPTPAWGAAWPLLVGGGAMIAPFSFPRPRGVGLALFACWALAVVGLHAVQ